LVILVSDTVRWLISRPANRNGSCPSKRLAHVAALHESALLDKKENDMAD
jgi:hypothetical protein